MSDILARIDEIKKSAPPPKFRAAYGRWVAPAWVVRGLVEKHGYGVMEAVRVVVNEEGHEPADLALKSIRQSYYQIKDRPWSEAKEAEQ